MHSHCLNQLIILTLLISISQTHQTNTFNSFKTRSRQGRTTLNDSSEDLLNDKVNNSTKLSSLPAESRQSDDDDLQFGSKPYYSSRLNNLDDYNHLSSNIQPKSFERRNLINAPDFQANAAGFILPDYLANSQSLSSSSSNILNNKLAPYEASLTNNGQSSLDDYASYLNEKNSNSFQPSTNLRERRKGYSETPQKSHSNNYNIYERQTDDQNQFDQLLAHKHLLKQHHNHGQNRDNEFASNSILESFSSPLDNQDYGLSNNFISNDFANGGSSYNNELSALNNLASLTGGIRSLNALSALNPGLGLNNGFNNNLSPLASSSSSLVGTLGGTLGGNGLGSVVPPGAIVGAPGSQPPPGMRLAGYVTVTNPSPNVGSMMQSPNNLLASPATQQQMLLNQVMNRSPQAQALAQVMAQSMSNGIRIPFANPYTNNLQLIPANGLNGLQSTSSNSNSNSNNSNNGNSNSNSNSNNSDNSNSNLSNGEQQVAASSTNRAKFLQRLNPLNLFRRLRTRNQKNNSKQNNKNQSNTSNEIDNNSIPGLEDRSQYFLPADLLLGAASTNNQQQQLNVQQTLAEQLANQIAQLNLQLAQQSSNNKAKFLRKMGNNYILTNSPTTTIKKVTKRDLTSQLNETSLSANNSSIDETTDPKSETMIYSLGDLPNSISIAKTNASLPSSNDTETAENGYVADIYQNYKFNIRPRFRFPSAREQRRISNVHGLHVNTNNFLTSSSMKSNFVGLMGSRNYEILNGGILNNEGHRNTDHSMLHGMHSNNGNHKNHHLPHHHNNQRNLGHMMSNKGNKFNIDNDFDDDDEEDDSMNNSGYNNSPMGNNGGNTNSNQRNGNNVMFLDDDDLFGSNMQNGQGKNNNMLGFQGFNNFNSNQHHFNALSSASTFNNQQLNNATSTDDKKDSDSKSSAS